MIQPVRAREHQQFAQRNARTSASSKTALNCALSSRRTCRGNSRARMHRRCSRSLRRTAACGPCATAAEHQPAVAGGHAGAKAVGALALQIARLESSLAHGAFASGPGSGSSKKTRDSSEIRARWGKWKRCSGKREYSVMGRTRWRVAMRVHAAGDFRVPAPLGGCASGLCISGENTCISTVDRMNKAVGKPVFGAWYAVGRGSGAGAWLDGTGSEQDDPEDMQQDIHRRVISDVIRVRVSRDSFKVRVLTYVMTNEKKTINSSS
jgi:hypothetical protein